VERRRAAQLYARGVDRGQLRRLRGDNLIRPIDINYPQPADVLRANGNRQPGASVRRATAAINPARDDGAARYYGLLVSFRHDAGAQGLVHASNYTLSRNRRPTRATIATRSTSRRTRTTWRPSTRSRAPIARHIFTANYVYELPFFKNSTGLVKAVLGGWQVSGITTINSGQPISRVVGSTNGFRRGIRRTGRRPVHEPAGDDRRRTSTGSTRPPSRRRRTATYGNTGRAIFRLPGRNQWDITLSKNFYPTARTRLQFRADFINAFNHTQLDPAAIQNTCTVAVSCRSTGNFGAMREIQLGLRSVELGNFGRKLVKPCGRASRAQAALRS
jgi:hypothetical protein